MNTEYKYLKEFNAELIRIFTRFIKSNDGEINKGKIYEYFRTYIDNLNDQLDKPIEDIINLIIKEGKFIDIDEFIGEVNYSSGVNIKNKTQLINFMKNKFKDYKLCIFQEPLMYLLNWSRTRKTRINQDFYPNLNRKVREILDEEFNCYYYICHSLT